MAQQQQLRGATSSQRDSRDDMSDDDDVSDDDVCVDDVSKDHPSDVTMQDINTDYG